MTTGILIDGNKVYISTNTNTCNSGYILDLDNIGARNCLLLMDKLKRVYFDKLQSEKEV